MIKMGQLRIWHYPNLGSKLKYVEKVETKEEAKMKLNTLAKYDLILGDLIHSNAQDIEIYVGNDVPYETNDGWEDWED